MLRVSIIAIIFLLYIVFTLSVALAGELCVIEIVEFLFISKSSKNLVKMLLKPFLGREILEVFAPRI
ncbi:MAG: hypothetical protein CMB67_01070 [Euryarchaeota archaeon]|nr:hypothetical protein [Euryarchaeota archaeon]|tara:strand:- start:69 stop:269 length:201 start_codon:yes stop_codon:yes gene_type:complete